jgi:hypothetical protein
MEAPVALSRTPVKPLSRQRANVGIRIIAGGENAPSLALDGGGDEEATGGGERAVGGGERAVGGDGHVAAWQHWAEAVQTKLVLQ